jgi:carboxymethylenebutenolidase
VNSTLDVNTPDGTFKAYITRPAILPAPAIVVVQEIFGVNADLRDTCDELAKQGYFALSPDLFWRMEPGVDLSDQTEAEWKKGFALYTAFDYPSGVSDIAATLPVARTLAGASGKVGLMGYCISKDAQREIIAALAGNEFAEVFTYPGCSHAFARHRGIHFDKDAARLANRRTADFFQRHLT